jgi:hypothetical protein
MKNFSRSNLEGCIRESISDYLIRSGIRLNGQEEDLETFLEDTDNDFRLDDLSNEIINKIYYAFLEDNTYQFSIGIENIFKPTCEKCGQTSGKWIGKNGASFLNDEIKSKKIIIF